MFDASFMLSFLCVAAIGALAMPLLEANVVTAVARRHGRLRIVETDPHLDAARSAVSGRNAAGRGDDRTCGRGFPVRWALAGLVAMVCAIRSIRVRDGPDFDRDSDRAGAADGGIFPSRVVYRADRESADRSAGDRAWCPLGFLAIFTGWRWVARIAGGAAPSFSDDRGLARAAWNRTGGWPTRRCGSRWALSRH